MINLHEYNLSFDVSDRIYRCAILNLLIHFKPKYCLEIGTHLYQTSRVFSYYFNKYQPEGKLITTDVGKYNRDEQPPDKVYPLMVYPYTKNIEQIHSGLKVFREDWKELFDDYIDPLIENTWIIEDELERLGLPYKPYSPYIDFTFVDGDHSFIAIQQDLKLAKEFTSEDGYILIDDIEDKGHAQYDYYKYYLKPKNPSFKEIVGMGLIRAGDLQL